MTHQCCILKVTKSGVQAIVEEVAGSADDNGLLAKIFRGSSNAKFYKIDDLNLPAWIVSKDAANELIERLKIKMFIGFKGCKEKNIDDLDKIRKRLVSESDSEEENGKRKVEANRSKEERKTSREYVQISSDESGKDSSEHSSGFQKSKGGKNSREKSRKREGKAPQSSARSSKDDRPKKKAKRKYMRLLTNESGNEVSERTSDSESFS